MALLNIKKTEVPDRSTHISQDGRYIKDNGQSLCDGREFYYVWHRGEWIFQTGRHLSKIVIAA